LRSTPVTLDALSPTVVSSLVSRLKLSEQDSRAHLEGDMWTIMTSAKLFDAWQARYDGTGLHQTHSRADLKPGSSGPTGASPSGKLLACVRRADQNVKKLVACERE
jgi:hypothetical protein